MRSVYIRENFGNPNLFRTESGFKEDIYEGQQINMSQKKITLKLPQR